MRTRTIWLFRLLLILLAMWGVKFAHSEDTPVEKKPAYLGIRFNPSEALPESESYKARFGIVLNYVAPSGPAYKHGLKVGDIVVGMNGGEFASEADKISEEFMGVMAGCHAGQKVEFWVLRESMRKVMKKDGVEVQADDAAIEKPVDFVRAQQAGVEYEIHLKREYQLHKIKVVMGERVASFGGGAIPSNAEINPLLAKSDGNALARCADVLAGHYGIGEQYADLLARLAALENAGDSFRRRQFAFVHRDAYRMGESAEQLFERIVPCETTQDTVQRMAMQAKWLLDIPSHEEKPYGGLRTGVGLDEHVTQLEGLLAQAAEDWKSAFSGLSEEEMKFLRGAVAGMWESFEEQIYIDADNNAKRMQDNMRIIELAQKVDYGPLLRSAWRMSSALSESYLKALQDDLRAAGVDAAQEVIVNRETPYGRVILGGTAGHWYCNPEETAFGLLIDFGGDDFYSDAVAASSAAAPMSVLIDCAGNDAYEASVNVAQGAGVLGTGILMDLAGDDSYVGLRMCQGASFLGVGVLADGNGNDSYRSHAYAQGCGFWGAAMLIEQGGNDRYESHLYAQAVAIAGSVAFMIEKAGDDTYYSKGTLRSGYDTPGIFEGWSQGCAVGLRGHVSGGIAALYDCGGKDFMEAGDFSQGGGYYFGWGLFRAGGNEDDRYLGARYAQGFCAHEAGGTFIEDGGNDIYQAREAVLTGLAWDECVVWFEDKAGDDSYEIKGFSLGASAHNSIVIWLDRGGKDRYVGSIEPALAGGNDYHGGISLSLVFDLGGEEDEYSTVKNNAMTARAEYGFFFDGLADPSDMLADGKLAAIAPEMKR